MNITKMKEALQAEGLAGIVDADILATRVAAIPQRQQAAVAPIRDLIQWLDDQRAIQHMYTKRESLNDLTEWRYEEDGTFGHKMGRFFRIVGITVTSPDREIGTWDQPIIENIKQGVIGLLVRRVAGHPYFLLQAKAEFGNRPYVQIGPTVQFTPGNYEDNIKLKKPFLYSEFITPGALGKVIYDAFQSEEGARFLCEAHLHRVIEVPEDWDREIPDNFRWFSLDATRFFLHLGEEVNSCARSILTCLL